MTSSLAPILLVLLSGALLSIQSPINATLARAMGSSVNGALVSFLVGTVALVSVVTVAWLMLLSPRIGRTRYHLVPTGRECCEQCS